jgi:hypothetical protein
VAFPPLAAGSGSTSNPSAACRVLRVSKWRVACEDGAVEFASAINVAKSTETRMRVKNCIRTNSNSLTCCCHRFSEPGSDLVRRASRKMCRACVLATYRDWEVCDRIVLRTTKIAIHNTEPKTSQKTDRTLSAKSPAAAMKNEASATTRVLEDDSDMLLALCKVSSTLCQPVAALSWQQTGLRRMGSDR